jgi:hypothetical protein
MLAISPLYPGYIFYDHHKKMNLHMFAATPRFARGKPCAGFKFFTFQNNKHQNPKT